VNSGLYVGTLRHRRREPRPHEFRYRLFMAWLDLAELDDAFRGRWLWSARRPALARFRREDHLGDPAVPLEQAVRDLVEERTGRRPAGPIRLLTHLRYFGYVFNPVSFYYCYDRAGERVECVVAEVNNTPWGERHCYVMQPDDTTPKAMHVSPFMPMDLDYRWRFSAPGERLSVHMTLCKGARTLFDATLALRKRPFTNTVLLAYPLMTLKVIAAIHWEALRLWLKGVPFHTHPAKRRSPSASSVPASSASSTASSTSAAPPMARAPAAARSRRG
jgi:DUF1365 family protein